ncbi:MAG: hypothetical protein AB1439_00080 [candidate division FCPU426 bacterium]
MTSAASKWDSLKTRFSKLTPQQKWWLKLGLLALFVLISPSGGRLLGPLFLLLFWSLASAENRTISWQSIGVAAVWGLVALVPAASIVETPVLALAGEENLWTAGWCTFVEVALVGGSTAALLLWPKSRLRLTGGILDYAILGLAVGAGFEAGLGVLSPTAAGFHGIPFSVLPQLPGLLGHPTQPSATASPASWGLAFGLCAGLLRYLFGPDLHGLKTRLLAGAAAGLLLAWLVGERLAYAAGADAGWWSVWFAVDLKGRLLAYLSGIGTGVIILVEWLLLQGRPHSEPLWQPLADYSAAWTRAGADAHATLYSRLQALLGLEEWRNALREYLQAEEIRPLLSAADQARLELRLEHLRRRLAAREGEGA